MYWRQAKLPTESPPTRSVLMGYDSVAERRWTIVRPARALTKTEIRQTAEEFGFSYYAPPVPLCACSPALLEAMSVPRVRPL